MGHAVPKILAVLCHLTILTIAYFHAHSASGFLLTGLGSALLLDRYFLRLLSWPAMRWKRDLPLHTAWFLLGATAFYLVRPGIVPVREAVFRGAMVVLLVFLIEVPLRLHSRVRPAWYLPLVGILLALYVPVLGALHPLRTVPKRGPEAFGIAFEDVRFRTADGVELAAWVIPHPEARGNVIFCHGHGRNRGHVAGLLPTLHDLGLNVLAFDFRGHGDSEGHTSTFGQREVQDVLAAAAYLRRRYPEKPLFLVGISLGAAVSLQALHQLPDVRGVWSEGAFSRFRHEIDHEFAWLPDGLRGPLVRGYWCVGWLDCGFWAPAVNPVDALKDVRVPICFCHAREDELVPLSEGEELYAAYAGPKWCWWVEGATHYDVRQQNREEYLGRLRGFVEDAIHLYTIPSPIPARRSRCSGDAVSPSGSARAGQIPMAYP
jgi:pimeloyl-ACP methyl ester carboxylesterase